jgi:hypothetical protein
MVIITVIRRIMIQANINMYNKYKREHFKGINSKFKYDKEIYNPRKYYSY